MFTDQDVMDLAARGVTTAQVKGQLSRFRSGFPSLVLERPCMPDDGITRISPPDEARLVDVYKEAAFNGRTSKFVPASGAGSRMFQSLYALKNQSADVNSTDLAYRASQGDKDAAYGVHFFNSLEKFPFYTALRESIGNDTLLDMMKSGQYQVILDRLLTENGFNYPDLPKGLLPFHQYHDHMRTPIEEHLVEAMACTKSGTGQVKIHFTVSPEHLDAVQQHIDAILSRYNQDTTFEITFSTQMPSTDTIAVDMNNHPFRDGDGRLLFRAGGHGALLENLNALQGDILFVKNIDNVVPDHMKEQIHRCKRMLGGYLVDIQKTVFEYTERLDENPTSGLLDDLLDFCRTKLCLEPPASARQSDATKKKYLSRILDRPMRVCGMVKNTGEPGGGPFWVKSDDGGLTPQIVESAQVNPDQVHIFKASTHFNPVDLVCGVRNRYGVPYDLIRFRDPDTGFISSKSKDGRPLKALEHPGLWNGSMADWHTIFIEVPEATFNPVKTINDLLRPAHQPM